MTTKEVQIPQTKWFPVGSRIPGQPGVFMVNSVPQFDGEASPRRFSYHNGREFGPVRSTPEGAYAERFNPTVQARDLTHFCGLSE